MKLPRDLVEMLAAFEGGGVRYLIVGGHAVSLHARPRATKDLDLWLDAARDNVERACAALTAFGIPGHLVEAVRNARTDEIVWLGRPPARIDLLWTIPGVDFPSAWRRRVRVDLEGLHVSIVGLEDLVANKRATGRPQDLRDVRALEKTAKWVLDTKSKRRR